VGRRRTWLVLALALASVAPSCAGGSDSPRPVPRLWIVTGGWFDQIRYDEPAIAHQLFLRAPSVIIGPHHLTSPARKSIITSFAWASFRYFGRSIRTGHGFYRGFTDAMYDPEGWEATPIAERRDPVAYFERFSELARQRGWTVIITPHPNLTTVPGARCGTLDDESELDAFLRCGLTGEAARWADIVEIQAQQLETDPAAYRAFVVEAAAQARAANPGVQVIVGLTTGLSSTAEQMFRAWDSVRDLVDGYYLAIIGNERVPVALRFLRMLPGGSTPSNSDVSAASG
jgi:hypothetical protein